jgi:hypothetical protein
MVSPAQVTRLKYCMHFSLSHVCHVPPLSHAPWADHTNNIWRGTFLRRPFLSTSLHRNVVSSVLYPNILLSIYFHVYSLRLKDKISHKHKLTNSMEQSSFWEANSQSATQEIYRLLLEPNDHYRVHNSPPMVPVLNQMHPVHHFPSYFICIRHQVKSYFDVMIIDVPWCKLNIYLGLHGITGYTHQN